MVKKRSEEATFFAALFVGKGASTFARPRPGFSMEDPV